jgi:hypothetical protein
MATTTTNFGWDIPQSTDLVKDGATAIAALGQDIDTALVDLKGGTTNQVLAKASATDLDYAWANGADVVPSSYGFTAGKNKIINGDFSINQRAFTSTSTSTTYGFDRWRLTAQDGTTTFSAQTFTPGTAPVAGYEGTNFARLASTGQTLTSAQSRLQNRIESVRTFAGQTVTLSFWAKASSGTPSIAVNIAQDFGSGGSALAEINGQKTAITTSWVRYSFVFAVPSISGKTIGTGDNLRVSLWTSAGSDQNTQTNTLGIQTATIDFWGVQLEAASTASNFQTATGTIQGELAACQRYYTRFNVGTLYGYSPLSGYATSTTNITLQTVAPVPMRVAPNTIDFGGAWQTGGASNVLTTNFTNTSNNGQVLRCDATVASGAVTNGFYQVLANNNASSYIGWNSEL